MTTAADRVFVDTNVLIYARSAASPFHAQAVSRLGTLEASGAELWLSRQVLREYLAAMTKPGAVVPPIPLPALLADVHGFLARCAVA